MTVSPELRAYLRRMIDEARNASVESTLRDVALATDALPVHIDMGGALVVTTEGAVLEYDFEADATSVAPENFRLAALAKAARRFPELQDLAPRRPENAVTCPACAGTGVILGKMDCGTCMSLGWVAT